MTNDDRHRRDLLNKMRVINNAITRYTHTRQTSQAKQNNNNTREKHRQRYIETLQQCAQQQNNKKQEETKEQIETYIRNTIYHVKHTHSTIQIPNNKEKPASLIHPSLTVWHQSLSRPSVQVTIAGSKKSSVNMSSGIAFTPLQSTTRAHAVPFLQRQELLAREREAQLLAEEVELLRHHQRLAAEKEKGKEEEAERQRQQALQEEKQAAEETIRQEQEQQRRLENQRLFEEQESQRREQEEKERRESEKRAAEKEEAERLARELQEQQWKEAEKRETQRIEAERAEVERRQEEKREAERLEEEKRETEEREAEAIIAAGIPLLGQEGQALEEEEPKKNEEAIQEQQSLYAEKQDTSAQVAEPKDLLDALMQPLNAAPSDELPSVTADRSHRVRLSSSSLTIPGSDLHRPLSPLIESNRSTSITENSTDRHRLSHTLIHTDIYTETARNNAEAAAERSVSSLSIPSDTNSTTTTTITAAAKEVRVAPPSSWINAADRDALFTYLTAPDCLLFTSEIKWSNKALDLLLLTGGSAQQTIDICQKLDKAGTQVETVHQLKDNIIDAINDMAVPTTITKPTAVAPAVVPTSTAVNEERAEQEVTVKNEQPNSNLREKAVLTPAPVVASLPALAPATVTAPVSVSQPSTTADWITESDRESLFSYLSGDESSLFSSNVALSNRTLNALLMHGGNCQETINRLKALDEQHKQFETVNALIEALKTERAASNTSTTQSVAATQATTTAASASAATGSSPGTSSPVVPRGSVAGAGKRASTSFSSAWIQESDRQQLIAYLTAPTTNLFTTPMKFPPRVLDTMLTLTGSSFTCLEACAAIQHRGQIFPSLAAFLAAIKAEMSTMSDRRSISTASNTSSANNSRPVSPHAQNRASRDALFAYLSSPYCHLFSTAIKLNNFTLDHILFMGKGLLATLAHCHYLDEIGCQYQTVDALAAAVSRLAAQAEGEQQQIYQLLNDPTRQSHLFLKLPLSSTITMEQVVKLYWSVQAGSDTLAYLEMMEEDILQAVHDGFYSLDGIRHEMQRRHANMRLTRRKEMEKIYEYLLRAKRKLLMPGRPENENVAMMDCAALAMAGRENIRAEQASLTMMILEQLDREQVVANDIQHLIDIVKHRRETGPPLSSYGEHESLPPAVPVLPTKTFSSATSPILRAATLTGPAALAATAPAGAVKGLLSASTSNAGKDPASSWITAGDRDALFDALANADCCLFSKNVKLNNKALDSLLVAGGSVARTIDLCKQLDDQQEQFETVVALREAIVQTRAQRTARTNTANATTTTTTTATAGSTATTTGNQSPAAPSTGRSTPTKSMTTPDAVTITSEDRDALFTFLAEQSDLFDADVKLNNKALNSVLTAGKGRENTIQVLRRIEAAGIKSNSVATLVSEMQKQQASGTAATPSAGLLVPLSPTTFSAEDRDALFDWLASAECDLFISSVQLSSKHLNAILTYGQGLDNTIRSLKQFKAKQQQFNTVHALQLALQNEHLPNNSTSSQPNTPGASSSALTAATATSPAGGGSVTTPVSSPPPPPPVVPITAADRDRLFDYLSSESCHLFATDAKLSNKILDRILIATQGITMALSLCKLLNTNNQQIHSTNELIDLLTLEYNQQTKQQQELLLWLQTSQPSLLPNDVVLDGSMIQQLYMLVEAGGDTLLHCQYLQTLHQQQGTLPFPSFPALIAALSASRVNDVQQIEAELLTLHHMLTSADSQCTVLTNAVVPSVYECYRLLRVARTGLNPSAAMTYIKQLEAQKKSYQNVEQLITAVSEAHQHATVATHRPRPSVTPSRAAGTPRGANKKK